MQRTCTCWCCCCTAALEPHPAAAPPPAHTLSAGYSDGCEGAATSQMHSSPSAAPDASRLGLNELNSRPLTCRHRQGAQQQPSAAACFAATAARCCCSLALARGLPAQPQLTAPVCLASLESSAFWPPPSSMAAGFHRQMLPSAKPPAMIPYCAGRACVSLRAAAAALGCATATYRQCRILGGLGAPHDAMEALWHRHAAAQRGRGVAGGKVQREHLRQDMHRVRMQL